MARPIRDDLKNAVNLLQEAGDQLARGERHADAEKHHDAAAAVRAILAPGGWAFLKESDRASSMSNLAVQMDKDLKGQLESAAQEFAVPLPVLAAEALRAAAEGRFVPPRAYSGPGARTNLNVGVPTELKNQVSGMLSDLTEMAGYRVSLASIVTWWMADELFIDLPDTDAEPVAGRIDLVIPSRLREHFVQSAERRGVELQGVLERGIQELVAERWEYPAGPRAAKGTRPQDRPVKLRILVRNELLTALREMAPKLAMQHSRRIHPGTVAIAILRDRLGEPE